LHGTAVLSVLFVCFSGDAEAGRETDEQRACAEKDAVRGDAGRGRLASVDAHHGAGCQAPQELWKKMLNITNLKVNFSYNLKANDVNYHISRSQLDLMILMAPK
jgi:hypothetical protein